MIKILFLPANPLGTKSLRLGEEVRAIQERLSTSETRDSFNIISGWTQNSREMQEALLRHKPNIVHFSGHGGSNNGIQLEGDDGQSILIPPQALKSLFTIFRDEISCIVLKGCISKDQAQAMLEAIGCIIYVPAGLGEKAAISFCSAFYKALAFGRNI